MIYVIMHGRLGNQMFQYAFAKKIQNNRSDDITLYFGKVNKTMSESGWSDDLKYFNVDKYHIVNNASFLFWKTSFDQKLLLLSYLLKCKRFKDANSLMSYQIYMQSKLNEKGIYWLRNGCFTPIPSEEKNIFISGHFEYAPLYEDMKDTLRKQYTPKHSILESNKELMNIIRNTESVCVSIRRGDFLSDKNKNVYYLCDEKYFELAIQDIRNRVNNPTLIFFSDDVEWVKNRFEYDGPVYYESPDNPIWEKIRLMASCKHFIISNSTFSWWVQYLSTNKDKVVISPNRWKNNSDYKGLIMDSFVKIDV